MRDEVVVTLLPQAPASLISEIARDLEGGIIGSSTEFNLYEIQVPVSTIVELESVISQVQTRPGVAIVSFHWILESGREPDPGNDPLAGTWDEGNPGGNNYGQELVHLPSAWDYSIGSPNTQIAVIDDGFDGDHPDLQANVGLVGPGNIERAHGTRVAGILGAVGNNGEGITGAMWETNLLLFSVGLPGCPRCWDVPSAVLAARLAVANGARVINMSGGSHQTDPVKLQQANAWWRINLFERPEMQDVVFVLGAGNDGDNFLNFSPASLASSFNHLIAVGAVNEDRSRRLTSNFGVGVVYAPGTDIFSTTLDDTYDTESGTSFATPFVSGVAGLMFSRNDSLSPAEVKNIIVRSAESSGNDPAGNSIRILNAFCSLQSVFPFELISSSPASGSTGVPVDSSILLSFSADVDVQNVGANLQVFSSTGQQVSGTVLVLNQRSVSFIPSSPLAPGTAYLVDLRSVTDTCRNRLSGATQINFTTAFPPVAPPDLTITKTASADPISSGDQITFTMTVRNVGGAPADNVLVQDLAPGTLALTFTSCSASVGGCVLSPIPMAAFGTLAPAQTATFTLTATAPNVRIPTTTTNTARVVSNSVPFDLAKHQASVTVTINPQPNGLIWDLAVDPFSNSTVYAAGQGLFKSLNGGDGWKFVEFTPLAGASAFVSAIRIDHKDSALLYAAVGTTVLKSQDGGATWSSAGTGLAGDRIFDLAIDPTDSNTLYVAADSGVFKTTDGAQAWVALGCCPVPNFRSTAFRLAIDPAAPGTVYAGSDGGGVFKTTDGGTSWSQINSGLGATVGSCSSFVIALAIDPHAPQTVFVGTECAGIFKTVNGGQSWSPMNAGLANLLIGTIGHGAIAIDPTNSSIVYAGTGNGVFKTVDDGQNWFAANAGLTNVLVLALALDPNNPSTIYAGTGSGVFKSTDGGVNWTEK